MVQGGSVLAVHDLALLTTAMLRAPHPVRAGTAQGRPSAMACHPAVPRNTTCTHVCPACSAAGGRALTHWGGTTDILVLNSVRARLPHSTPQKQRSLDGGISAGLVRNDLLILIFINY